MDKLVNSKVYQNSKDPQLLRRSRAMLRSILSYESAADLASHCSFSWQSWTVYTFVQPFCDHKLGMLVKVDSVLKIQLH